MASLPIQSEVMQMVTYSKNTHNTQPIVALKFVQNILKTNDVISLFSLYK